MFGKNSKVVILDTTIHRLAEDENKYALLNIDDDSDDPNIYLLSEESFEIWKFLIDNQSISDLLDYLNSEYEFSKEDEEFVYEFLNDLVEKKLITISDE